jgi:uncharacterized caspase-like protein
MLIRALLLCLSVLALPATGAQAERRVALVIGNSAYANTTALRNPRNDAGDMADALRKVGFEVAVGLDLDQQRFAQAIERFARALDGADVALFYYAGHGLQMNERNFLVSVDAKLQNEFLLTSETIDLEAIVRLMESKSPVNLVFLDACRNNPLADGLRQSLAATKRSAALGRGLARIEPTGRDTLIAFAAAPGQVAVDGAGRNSPFTGSLLAHIDKPGLEVSVMLKEVAADVRRATQNAQRPQQLSDMARVFYFARAEAAATAAPAAPAPVPAAPVVSNEDRTVDVAFWNSVQAAQDCEAVRAYIRRFPTGTFIDLAKISEQKLCVTDRRVSIIETPAAVVSPPPAAAQPPAVASLPAPTQTPPEATKLAPELARNIQLELERLGCLSQVDEKWPTTRAALSKYNRHAKVSLDLDAPSAATMAALHDVRGRICPLECRRGFRPDGDECIAIERTKPRKATASRTDRPTERPERPRRERRAAPAAAAGPKSEFASPLCQSRIQVGQKWCCTYDPPRGPSIVICR